VLVLVEGQQASSTDTIVKVTVSARNLCRSTAVNSDKCSQELLAGTQWVFEIKVIGSRSLLRPSAISTLLVRNARYWLVELKTKIMCHIIGNNCHSLDLNDPTSPTSPTSYILHPTSYILHPTSYILHPTSYIPHPTSYILHPTSYILHFTSYILHPTSYILHLLGPNFH
jgi:hypothetical protein